MKRTGKTLPLTLAFVFTLAFMPLDALAKGGGFSGGGRSFGGSGFGSGSRSFSAPSAPRSYSAPSAPRSYSTPSAPRSYSTPSIPSTPRSFSTPGVSPPPRSSPTPAPKTQYDSGAGRAARKDLSQQKFDATQPKPSPTPPDYRNARVRDLRRDLSYERMQNRELRQQQTFGGYASRPVPCCYSDPFGNMFFWLWLMDRPRQERDTWVYNRRDEMDPARYEELRRKDTDLDRRLKEMESQGVKKDPSYVPPGVDRDLMYSDDHAKQAYKEAHTSRFPWGWVFGIVIILGLVYLVFFVRFKVRKR